MTEPTARRRGSFTRRLSLEEAPPAYPTFNDRVEDCPKVGLRPQERKDGQM